MNKLEIYGVLFLVVLFSNAAFYLEGHHKGRVEMKNEIAADVLKANTKVDTLNGQLQEVNTQHTAELAAKDKAHSDQLAAALASVKPVVVRVPATGGVQTGDSAAGSSGPSGQQPGNGSLPTSIDIAPAELMFGAKYQTCRDSLATYMVFYEDLRKRVNH